MEEPRAYGRAALGALLGLASVAELAARLVAGSTVRAGLAAGSAAHTGVSVPAALLMCALCLLATVPAVLLRPVPAAVTVGVASVLSLVLFELVTAAGAVALLVVAYRLGRGTSGGAARLLAVALAVPFVVIAVALAAAAWPAPVVGTVSGLAGAGGDTRVLAVLLASAIPVAELTGITQRARQDSRVHSAVRELTEGVLAEHLARGERANEVVRAGFAAILDTQPDFTVLGTAADGAEAVRTCQERHPDVVLMDIRMPGMDGIEATRLLTSAGCGPRVLVLTTFDLDEYVYDALRAGASGFLLKDVTAERLFDAVRVIAAGEALLAPAVTKRLIAEFARQHPRPAQGRGHLDALTPRETEVLRLMAGGLSNPEIAERLVVTEETVKTHVSRVLSKLGLRDRTQAVVAAYESGLVVPGVGGPRS